MFKNWLSSVKSILYSYNNILYRKIKADNEQKIQEICSDRLYILLYLCRAIYNIDNKSCIRGVSAIFKKILLAALLASFAAVACAREVKIPAVWNKTGTYAHLQTTESDDFYQYNNGRFFFHTYVPACLTRAALPANGDGITLQNDGGTVVFAASGSHNTDKQSAGIYYELAKQSVGAESVTYSDWGEGWYAVSGVRNGQVYYIKGLVGDAACCSIRFCYPYAEKENYDWMVPVLEKHFYHENRAL